MRGERRAFSNWRGTVRVRGNREVGALLRRAMAAPEDFDPRTLTHGFHAYPARLHPHLARTILATAPPGAAVLDPFCGSGTVLVEARLRGCRAIGRDINPLAVRLARLKTSNWTAAGLAALQKECAEVEARAKALLKSRTQAPPPPAARRDFDAHVAWELAALRDAIGGVKDAHAREALLLALSSILVKVSRREGATSERATEKHVPPGRTMRFFADRVRELGRNLSDFSRAIRTGTPAADVAEGDARELAGLAADSVDLILTSPPYAGHYRYLDAARMSAAWLGIPLESAGRHEIGAKGASGGMEAYRADLGRALAAARRVLAPAGRLFVVVGDVERGPRIQPGDRLLEELGNRAKLRLIAVASQPRPVFGNRGPRHDGKEKQEHLIWFQRAEPTP